MGKQLDCGLRIADSGLKREALFLESAIRNPPLPNGYVRLQFIFPLLFVRAGL